LLQLLAPMATKATQEMYEKIWYADAIHATQLPDFDPALCVNDSINLPVQINWKMRWTIEVAPWITQDKVLELVRQNVALSKYVEGEIKKVIFVQDKICNIII
jgi:leucyl-tRNA synthetase